MTEQQDPGQQPKPDPVSALSDPKLKRPVARGHDDVGLPSLRQSRTDRITVALIPKAGEDLETLQERTGLSRTDIVNRAISLNAFIEDQVQAGKELLVRDPETGETLLIRFL
jgi:hypothetical protein